MFQGKQCLEKFLKRIEKNLDDDPFLFVRCGFTLNDEETGYLSYPNFPVCAGLYTIPGVIDYFIGVLRERIPEEIFILETYLKTHQKIIDHLTHLMKTAKDMDPRSLSECRRALQDMKTDFTNLFVVYRKRNNGLSKNRRSPSSLFTEPLNKALVEYDEACDLFEEKLSQLLSMIPRTELAKLVDVLRRGKASVQEAYDRELESEKDNRQRVLVYYNPERISDLKILISKYLKEILFHLTTIRKRSLMYKPPVIKVENILARYQTVENLLPYFQEQESRLKPYGHVERNRQWRVAIYPTGRFTSPYTRKITSKGKETRMVEGLYYHSTNVLLLSGHADQVREDDEVSEVIRVFGEYIFDTLTMNVEYIRDPIGVGKEKGNYYSVIKGRQQPDLAKILKDTLDLRYHFSEDFVRFICQLEEGKEELSPELFIWFMTTLVAVDYAEKNPQPKETGKDDGNLVDNFIGFFK